MASDPKPSPTQLARDAMARLDLLTKDVQSLQTELEKADLPSLKERLAVLDDRVAELKRMKDEFEKLTKTVAVHEDRVNKLEKKDEESGKRGWQLLYIVIGAGLALFSSLIVQLVLAWAKSPTPSPHP